MCICVWGGWLEGNKVVQLYKELFSSFFDVRGYAEPTSLA